MTPELKTACEVVFQEHKLSNQFKWNKDAFRGRMSIGLSEMAKETLVKKNVLILPDKSKKVITLLNPDVASATSFEEAAAIIAAKTPALAASLAYDHSTYLTNHVYGYEIKLEIKPDVKPEIKPEIESPKYTRHVVQIKAEPETTVALLETSVTQIETSIAPIEMAVAPAKTTWYLRPVFYYFILPVCALAAGALISYLLELAQAKLFLGVK